MQTYNDLKKEFDQKVKNLQEKCPHKKKNGENITGLGGIGQDTKCEFACLAVKFWKKKIIDV